MYFGDIAFAVVVYGIPITGILLVIFLAKRKKVE